MGRNNASQSAGNKCSCSKKLVIGIVLAVAVIVAVSVLMAIYLPKETTETIKFIKNSVNDVIGGSGKNTTEAPTASASQALNTTIIKEAPMSSDMPGSRK